VQLSTARGIAGISAPLRADLKIASPQLRRGSAFSTEDDSEAQQTRQDELGGRQTDHAMLASAALTTATCHTTGRPDLRDGRRRHGSPPASASPSERRSLRGAGRHGSILPWKEGVMSSHSAGTMRATARARVRRVRWTVPAAALGLWSMVVRATGAGGGAGLTSSHGYDGR
jgi:hypothetical protein